MKRPRNRSIVRRRLATTLLACLLTVFITFCAALHLGASDSGEDGSKEDEPEVPKIHTIAIASHISFWGFPKRVAAQWFKVDVGHDEADALEELEAYAILVTEKGTKPDQSQARFAPMRRRLTVDLGTATGVKEIWFGFKGRAKHNEFWASQEVRYEHQAPPIVILAPTNRVMSGDRVEVRGYSLTRLMALHCLHFNEDGGLVCSKDVHQYSHPTASEPEDLEENKFSFGLELLKGTNTVELSGTNRLGQAVSTNFVLLLDWSHDTNPPHLQLRYPASGMSMPESRFLADGRVDDPSADISAVVVSGELTTNRFGSVQPHGDEGPKFFINDVPLLGETNLLTITAMDLAGNETSTSIVVQADVVVAYHALKLDHSRRIIERIGGWVRPGHRVLVNEQEATVEGTNWSAVTIPMRSGDPEMFVVKAIPVRPNPAATQR